MGGVELVVTLHGRGRACPARRFAWADVCGWLPGGRVLAAAGVSAGGNPGKNVGASLRGASGTPPPTVCPGKGGRGSLPLIRPCGATFPRGGRQGLLLAAAQGFAGRRGRRPLRLARERVAGGSCPSSGPAGPPSPQGGRQGLLLAAAGGRGGVGAPRPTDGDMETLRGLRGHPFPGRRTVGAGHARPGGWREHPSMVRSVGRGLDPSAGGCPGDGCWRKVSRGVGDAAPYGLPGNGWLPRLTLPTSPPAYSRCCRRQNRWGRSAHRPDARFRRWIRSRGASGHRRSGPEGTGVCRRRNFSSAG